MFSFFNGGTELVFNNNVPLLVSSCEKRSLRTEDRQSSSSRVTSQSIKVKCFVKYGKFLSSVIKELKRYFDDWPQWLLLSERLFLFAGS